MERPLLLLLRSLSHLPRPGLPSLPKLPPGQSGTSFSLVAPCDRAATSAGQRWLSTESSDADGVDGAAERQLQEVRRFVSSIGGGVEGSVDKIASKAASMEQLLGMRSGALKKLGLPCKQRKRVLRFTERARQTSINH